MGNIKTEAEEVLGKYLINQSGKLKVKEAVNWYNDSKGRPDYCREVWLEVLLLEYFWLLGQHKLASHPLDRVTKTHTQIKTREVGLIRASGVVGVQLPQRRFGYFVRADQKGTEVWSGICSTETVMIEYPDAVAQYSDEVNVASLGKNYAWFLSGEEGDMSKAMALSSFYPANEILGSVADIAFVMQLAQKYQ